MMVDVRVVVKLDVVMEEKVGQLEGKNTNTSQIMGIKLIRSSVFRFAEFRKDKLWT